MSKLRTSALWLPIALLPCLVAAQEPGTLTTRGNGGLTVVESDARDQELRTSPVVRAVQTAADSVVSIYILRPQAGNGGAALPQGQGSGVVLDEAGFVITNWHVVAPMVLGEGFRAEVRQRDGKTRPARVLSSSAEHDLALLQMELPPGEKARPVAIGRSADLMIGETVVAIGNPQGHANTVTAGVLSAIGRSIRVRAPDGVVRDYKELLQTDAAINQGNSGGALLDITGKLIGINNAMAVGAENIGFAIPVDTVRQVFENELIRSDSFATSSESPWLGLRLQPAERSLQVAAVYPGGPADSAGVRQGDELVAIAGNAVQTELDYARRVLTAHPGQPLPLRVRRAGAVRELVVRPATRLAFALGSLGGFAVDEVTADQDPDLVRRTTLAFYQGTPYRRVPSLPVALRVASTVPEGPAANLGLQPGDVIVSVVVEDPRFGGARDLRLDSARDLAALLAQRQGETVKLVVLRGREELVGLLTVRRGAPDYR